MKKSIRTIVLLSISVVYCFVISVHNGNDFKFDTTYSKLANSVTAENNPVLSPGLFPHTAQTESSVNVCNILPNSSIKNPFNGFSACAKATEQLFFSTFSQYDLYSKNISDRFQQTDIIFPFHYFW